jgi:hypothetical protein
MTEHIAVPIPTIELEADLAALSKQWLVDEIASNKEYYEQFVTFTEEELQKAEQCPLLVSNFDRCPYLSETEIKAFLVKFIPDHLLGRFQDVEAIAYDDTAVKAAIDAQGNLTNIAITTQEAQNEFTRVLAEKNEAEEWISIYNPEGMSADPTVLKILLLHALTHDLGHGVIDHFFATNNTVVIEQMKNVAYEGNSVSPKSDGYNKEQEIFFQEEIAEMIRLYVFKKSEFQQNKTKYSWTENLFDGQEIL